MCASASIPWRDPLENHLTDGRGRRRFRWTGDTDRVRCASTEGQKRGPVGRAPVRDGPSHERSQAQFLDYSMLDNARLYTRQRAADFTIEQPVFYNWLLNGAL